MSRTLVVAALALVTAGACKKEATAAPEPAAVAAAAAANPAGRTIAINVSHKGYAPAKASARAGEALVLVFTRTEDVECGQFVKVPGVAGQTELPVGKPVAIPVTMPADGELVFTCGMDMM